LLTKHSKAETQTAVPIKAISSKDYESFLNSATSRQQSWLSATGFKPDFGSICLFPNSSGKVGSVLLGLGAHRQALRDGLWAFSVLPKKLPPGDYRLAGQHGTGFRLAAAIGWEFGCYRFARYKPQSSATMAPARLCMNDAAIIEEARTLASAHAMARDMINTPAENMNPDELERVVRDLATRHDASVIVIKGDDLLKHDFRLIHAVGRASAVAPRLIDLTWGSSDDPRLTLVGKGLCFDSGGLQIKPGGSMSNMHCDMAGAANILALASLVMQRKLKVRLRVLICAAENMVAGNAYKPHDIFYARNGVSVEVGHTDAEGRLVLADALAFACEERPEVLIDMATLTGTARAAFGRDIAVVLSSNTDESLKVQSIARQIHDPVWAMPLWEPYRYKIQSRYAEVVSTVPLTYPGDTMLAALFLERFARDSGVWFHADIPWWDEEDRPGRVYGAEASCLRSFDTYLVKRFGKR